MKIIGLRIEKYIDKEVSGHNCDFEYNDAEFEKQRQITAFVTSAQQMKRPINRYTHILVCMF